MNKRIYLALDGFGFAAAVRLLEKIADKQELVAAIKIHNLYDKHGCEAIESIKSFGLKVWVDLKFHDIPRTVGLRARALFENGASVVTVMAKGGEEMMKEAVSAAKEFSSGGKVYAVTVLTSLSEEEYGQPIGPEVVRLAKLAAKAGVDGVVCSGQEVGALATLPELQGLDLVVPGTRSLGADVKDQKRVVTPEEAMMAGATHLVAGSQIVESQNPLEALIRMYEEM